MQKLEDYLPELEKLGNELNGIYLEFGFEFDYYKKIVDIIFFTTIIIVSNFFFSSHHS